MGLDQIPFNFPLECGPGPDHPQLPPWVWAWIRSPSTSPWLWAWIRSPSTSPLGVGLENPPQDQAPPGTRYPLDQAPRPGTPQTGTLRTRHPLPEQAPPGPRHPPGPAIPPGPGTPPPSGTRHPSPRGQTDTCKHITLPQTSFAGGNDWHSYIVESL